MPEQRQADSSGDVISCIKPQAQTAREEGPRPRTAIYAKPRPSVAERTDLLRQQAQEPAPVAPSPQIEQPEERSIDDWKEIIEESGSDDPMYEKAFDEVLKGADSLDDVEWLYDQIGSDSPLVQRLLDKLSQCREPVSDWITAYGSRSSLDVFSEALLKKSISMASSPSEWIALWNEAENSSDDDLQAVKEALGKTDWPQENWEEFRDDGDGDQESFAFDHLLAFKASAVDIIQFYLDYIEGWDADSDVIGKILKKLFSVTTRQEAQIIAKVAENEDLRDTAEEFLKQ